MISDSMVTLSRGCEIQLCKVSVVPVRWWSDFGVEEFRLCIVAVQG